MEIKDIVEKYKTADKDKIFPFSEWLRRDIFERLLRDFLKSLGYNSEHITYEDATGLVEVVAHPDRRLKIYLSSLKEEMKFYSDKLSAKGVTIPDPETGASKYSIAVATNFEKWFFYFDGREVYAVSGARLGEEYETVKNLISREAIATGVFRDVARRLIHKEDNEPLRQALNDLRRRIASKILLSEHNLHYLKNPDGSYNNELLNEITTRWITRFLALKLAEDFEISFDFTLRDIRKSFFLTDKTAHPVREPKVKEETLSNAVRKLMNEFERKYNGGIFMYHEGVDYITLPDSALFDLLDFTTGWTFGIEDARIIGFVYERFLGQEIVVEEERGRPGAVLKNIGEARGRRKAGGIYYTPKYIVDYIVDSTLGEILKQKREELDRAVKEFDIERFVTTLKEAKSLKVLDPACGSGSFLIKVLAVLKNFYEDGKVRAREIKSGIEKLKKERLKTQNLFATDEVISKLENKWPALERELKEIEFPGTFALRNNIYGVDIDRKAIDISAFTLMVQIYDELKDGARCPTMLRENLKVGNSLVSAITPDRREGFISRGDLAKYKNEIKEIIRLRNLERGVDQADENSLRSLIQENFDDVVDIYLHIKEKYPAAILTAQQTLLNEWHRRAKKEPIEKTYDVLINQTGLARIFLKEVFFEKIERIKEKIEFEINKPLIRYFNSEKRVLNDRELENILKDDDRLKEEYKFIKERATEISKSQPPKVFNWELEFPEVFFNEDGTLKENPGFDVVVGNPPYELIIGELYKGIIPYITFRYPDYPGRKNTFWLFIDSSKGILRHNGRHSFIVPSTILCDIKTRVLREKIFVNGYTYSLISFKESVRVFENVLQSVCVFAYINRRLDPQLDTVRVALGLESPKIPPADNFVIRKWKNLINITSDLSVPLIFSDKVEYILLKVKELPKLSTISHIYQGDVNLTNHAFAFTDKETQYPLIRGDQIEPYYIKVASEIGRPKERYVDISKLKNIIDTSRIKCIRLMTQQVANMELKDRLKAALTNPFWIVGNSCNVIEVTNNDISSNFVLGLINSSFWEFLFKLFSTNNHINVYEIESLPIVRASKDQQSPIISLVDAIIQKKKEYHAISQNIEDYIDFENANLVRLDEFLKGAVEDFEVLSSLKVKHDNFDALRLRFENNQAVIEYGIKKEVGEYEVIEEDEENEEVERRKYVIEWKEAGRGKIKNELAVEFLSNILEREKRISKARNKTVWEKIAEVEVPEFTKEVKEGFHNYKQAIARAKKLDEEILKIDRAIDRLVYDLYGLAEDEIKVVEESIWGACFADMYSKLPETREARKLAGELMGESG